MVFSLFSATLNWSCRSLVRLDQRNVLIRRQRNRGSCWLVETERWKAFEDQSAFRLSFFSTLRFFSRQSPPLFAMALYQRDFFRLFFIYFFFHPTFNPIGFTSTALIKPCLSHQFPLCLLTRKGIGHGGTRCFDDRLMEFAVTVHRLYRTLANSALSTEQRFRDGCYFTIPTFVIQAAKSPE